MLYVPIPCLFELGNHISHVDAGRTRRELAQKLSQSVLSSIDKSIPWTIVPAPGIELLTQLQVSCTVFAQRLATQRVALTDSFVAQEALRLKSKYSGQPYEVHIWTKDQTLKRLEPDPEANPFVG